MSPFQKTLVLGLAALLISGTARAYEPTDSEWKEGADLIEQTYWTAQSMEREADALAASGKTAEAYDKYIHAVARFDLTPSFKFNILRGAMPVREGWRLDSLPTDGVAYHSGIREGDILTAVDGVSLSGMDRMKVGDFIESKSMDPLRISYLRNDTPAEITLTDPDLYYGGELTTEPGMSMEPQIRGKMVALCAKTPGLGLPPSPMARNAAIRAQDMAKKAHTAEEIKNADFQFRAVTLAAPCWADVYVNYAIFQEAAGNAIGARENLAYYQQLRPDATDLAAIKSKVSDLSAAAESQQKLVDWEGWWSQLVNGKDVHSGYMIKREGNILTITNGHFTKPWLHATIIGDNTAEAYVRFADDCADMSPKMRQAIHQCFNDAMEVSVNMTLSPDRQHLTLEAINDIDFDLSNCHIVRQDRSTLTYVKSHL